MEETLRTSFKEKEHKDALREVLRRAIDQQRRITGEGVAPSALAEPRCVHARPRRVARLIGASTCSGTRCSPQNLAGFRACRRFARAGKLTHSTTGAHWSASSVMAAPPPPVSRRSRIQNYS